MPIDIKNFPSTPGVYLMKDAEGKILYIGKAKNLKKRVAAYFKKEAESRYQIKFLMERVADIEFIETESEKEAILLEYKLIHEHDPKYNFDLKDNKSFLFVKISDNEEYPAISVTRRVVKDGSSYFGPYISAKVCREMVDQAARFFKLRTCPNRIFSKEAVSCLLKDINKCASPCVRKIAKEAYAERIHEAKLFLKGTNKELLRHLRDRMHMESAKTNFEEASRIRDLIKGIKQTYEKVSKSTVVPTLRSGGATFSDASVIECVDISNIQGKVASGSIVCFADGKPVKSRYRLFNITRTDEPNDYAMMYEVLERRFKHTEWPIPDLLVVDGGRGQLSVAVKVLEKLEIKNLPVIALAKGKGSENDHVYLPNRVNPIRYKRNDPMLLYLMRIRDEAHRFGIAHYRRRHSKQSLAA